MNEKPAGLPSFVPARQLTAQAGAGFRRGPTGPRAYLLRLARGAVHLGESVGDRLEPAVLGVRPAGLEGHAP